MNISFIQNIVLRNVFNERLQSFSCGVALACTPSVVLPFPTSSRVVFGSPVFLYYHKVYLHRCNHGYVTIF